MNKGLTKLLVAGAIFVAAALPASAAKRVALVVGNASYQHTTALRNPVNDARDMAAKLKRLGFDVTTGIDLTEDAFAETLEAYFDKLKGAEAAVLFYAGHGLQFQNTNYLIPVDARLKSQLQVKGETIALSDIIREMEAQSPINLVFLDACRNNPLADRLQRSMTSRGRNLTLSRGLARVKSSAKDTLIAFAAAPGAVASDGKGRNSPFTAALLKHIETPGVEVEVMLKRVTAEVRTATEQGQEPERLSKLTTEFYFNPKEPVPAAKTASANPDTTAAADLAFWNAIKTSRDQNELNAYLTKFPRGQFAGLVTARIAKLRSEAEARAKQAAARPKPTPVAQTPQRVAPKQVVPTPAALFRSGLAHLTGKGATVDHSAGLKLMYQSAIKGNGDAMFTIGLLYERGRIVAQSNAQALVWYKKAVEAGDTRAAARQTALLQKIEAERIAALNAQQFETQAETQQEQNFDSFDTQTTPFFQERQRFNRDRRNRRENVRRNNRNRNENNVRRGNNRQTSNGRRRGGRRGGRR